MKIRCFFCLLFFLIVGCSDIASNDGSATEIGNPCFTATLLSSESLFLQGAEVSLAPITYNPYLSTGMLLKGYLNKKGFINFGTLDSGTYVISVLSPDSSEALIQKITIVDTVHFAGVTGAYSSLELDLGGAQSALDVYIPGTNFKKSVRVVDGKCVIDSVPPGFIPSLYSNGDSKELISTYTAVSSKAVSVVQNNWYNYEIDSQALATFDFSAILDVAVEGNGAIWCVTDNGLYYNVGDSGDFSWAVVNSMHFDTLNPPVLHAVVADDSDTVWIAGSEHVIQYFGAWVTHTTSNTGLSQNITSLTPIGTESGLYLGCKGGFQRVKNKVVEELEPSLSLSDDYFSFAMVTNSNGKLYSATNKEGLLEFDPGTNIWNQFQPSHYVESEDSLTELAIDSSGTIWTFDTRSVLRLNGDIWEEYSNWPGAGLPIVDIQVDNSGAVWLLSSSLLFRYKDGSVTTYSASGLSCNALTFSKNGTGYIGTSSGLVSF